MVLGIDVSHYSGSRDWHGLADRGISFAFAKASEGATIRDHLFAEHWRRLHDAGVACGAYHFAHPGSDPVSQATFFHAVVGDLAPTDLQPVLDLEVDDGQPGAQVVDWALTFVEHAEALFKTQLIVYTGGFWRRQIGNPACAPLGRRKLWIARYGGIPILPTPWSRWSIWQFSDGIHSAPAEAAALKCNCDWNRLADGLAVKDLAVAANPLQPAPLPKPAWPGRYFTYPATPTVSGPDVKQWQAQMVKLGWTLSNDGVFGPECKTACLSFQRNEGLVTDGIVGPKTWTATFAD